MEESISTSVSTVRSLHFPTIEIPPSSVGPSSVPSSSPRSSALPSPPDSPSSDSVSSFPSVASSVFFSSNADSPYPHHPSDSDHARDSTQGLVIPSLILPDALPRPTPFGQTLGDVRLLLLGGRGSGKTTLANLLVEDNEEVVERGVWEDIDGGRVLRASTYWIEHRDAHGLEKFEPAHNIEIVELAGYDYHDDVNGIVHTILSIVHAPFISVAQALTPESALSPVVANLLASSTSPLYTGLVFLSPSTPSSYEQTIVDRLGLHIPIVVLPRAARSRYPATSRLSSLSPPSALSLRATLFRAPDALNALRGEAVDRFLRWREVEHIASEISIARQHALATSDRAWSKAQWEAEWEATLSQDVSRRLRDRRGTVTAAPKPPCGVQGALDPLHLPSLVMFSLSLVDPLRKRVSAWVASIPAGLAMFGGFCLGLGIGFYVRV
ncbi:hypothetical protein EV121DRAFT_263840 [Schizophyllum commune]